MWSLGDGSSQKSLDDGFVLLGALQSPGLGTVASTHEAACHGEIPVEQSEQWASRPPRTKGLEWTKATEELQGPMFVSE